MTRQSKIQSLRDIWSALYWTIQRPEKRTRWEDVGGQINALTAEATILVSKELFLACPLTALSPRQV
ncbi:hypothetical protein K435DRAFT_881241 [Dendrothele bispora CBS 962.96]|uniref:Uncharacterized protein n=1 Tax=Dendrothele bispora (strain CBS 962.96) TaxID=1314807 RepID=A0A4S8KIK9_DENBC|nr:hypothetical protein K435DRAFT_881241 [Dendrothele bispora CBS 962.96]